MKKRLIHTISKDKSFNIVLGSHVSIVAIAYAVISLIILKFTFLKKKSSDKLVQAIWIKLASFGFSLGIVGLILGFLKHQRAPYLGMRLWLSLWLLICLVWLLFILKYIFLEIPKIRRARQAKAEFEKYLPK